MKIHERIRQLRIDKAMTQEELAKRLGYKSRASINKIELGYVDITCRKLEDFARALDVSPLYLTGWTNLNHEDKDILSRFTNLPEEYKGIVLDFIDKLLSIQEALG